MKFEFEMPDFKVFEPTKIKELSLKMKSSNSKKVCNNDALLNKFLHHFEELNPIIDRTDRLEFWRQYFCYYTNIECYNDYNFALVLETKKHTIIEFNGANGGATHFYKKEDLNIEQINEMQRQKYSKTKMKDKVLKNKALAINHMSHPRNNWEMKFHLYMKELGYETRSV